MPALAFRFAVLILAFCTVAVPAQIAQAAEAKATPSRDDPDRVICRREAVTGYLAMTKKVCMTRKEWAERTRNAQEVGQRMQEGGTINSCGSADPNRAGC